MKMKVKSFADLGNIYSSIADTNTQVPAIINEKTQADALLTDTSHYLSEGKDEVKAGSPLGGGPGAKKDKVILSSKTGPSGMKGNNFESVSKQALTDKSTDEQKDDVEEKAPEAKDAKEDEAVEKVEESAPKNNKYNNKPKSTMSKTKFDQLYEAAIKRLPFTEDADGVAEMPADVGVPPASDAAADADSAAPDLGEEEVPVTQEEAVECLKKVLKFLEKGLGGGDDLGGDLAGDDLDLPQGDGSEDGVVAEDVEAEDLGTPLDGLKKGKPDSVSKPVNVGDLKKTGGTAEKGKLTSEPEPKELGDKSGPLQAKSNKVGSGTVAKPGTKLFS